MARRKKSTPLEDVLDLLAMLPWWICVVLAAVSYFLLHRLAAPIQASDIQGQGGVMVGAMVQKAFIHGLANAGQHLKFPPAHSVQDVGISCLHHVRNQGLALFTPPG